MANIKNLFLKLHKSKGYSKRNNILKLINFHWPNRKKMILKFLKKKDLSCLQIGSSKGLDTKDFFNFKEKNFLIDVIDLNILTDKRYENINFIKKDFFKYKFIKKKYDIILIQGALHHLENYKKALKKIDNLIYPGGLVFLQCNNKLPFCNKIFFDNLRKKKNKKNFANVIKDLTLLGQFLSKTNSKINIKKDLKYLNIKKNHYSIHYLVHYFLIRLFYNNNLDFNSNFEHNIDWYMPDFSHEIDIDFIKKIKSFSIVSNFSPSPSSSNLILKKINYIDNEQN